ncbi:MAG: hypothetical protein K5770_09840 [Lachnospiraceae bacterium]|nr:hypothetical protein [Lachnospiraceae bacterium]
MRFSTTGFRDFLYHFIAVPLNERTAFAIEDFPECGGANYILTYCYCDPDYGLMLEILAPAMEKGGEFWYGEGSNLSSSHLYLYDYRDLDFGFVADDGSIADHFWFKLSLLREYDTLSTVEKTRQMGYLDEYRCETFIDQLFVGYGRDGGANEFYPTTILNYVSKYNPGVFIGRLDYEPENDAIGIHKGDIVMFSFAVVDGANICYCDLDRLEAAKEQFPDGFGVIAANADPLDGKTADNSPEDVAIDYMSSEEIYVPCNTNPDNENGLLPVLAQNNGRICVPLFMSEDDPRIPENEGMIRTLAADVIEIAGNNNYDLESIILYFDDEGRRAEILRCDFGTLFSKTRSRSRVIKQR